MSADEDFIDGSSCSICQRYFRNTIKWITPETNDVFVHGYPVACQDCFDDIENKRKVKKLNLQRAVIDNMF
jgi:hypothetical protein